jgi:superfamily II DNA or RNA helicase
MSLVFLPDRRRFFAWGAPPPSVLPAGEAATIELVTPSGVEHVQGTLLPLVETVSHLAALPTTELPRHPASLACWALASKLALDLVSRERVVPTLVREGESIVARWGAALSATDDAASVIAIARTMPPAAHAVPARAREVWAPEALMRAFLDAVVDALVRDAQGAPELPARKRASATDEAWEARWQRALSTSDGAFALEGFRDRTLLDDVARWSEPARGAHDRLRASFRLELPAAERDAFVLRFLLQSPDDPSLLVEASEVWSTSSRSLARLGRAFRDPQESLLEALGRAARLYPPIAASLREAKPESLTLDPATAWTFLSDGAPALGEAGFGVIVPAELTAAGQRRLRLRMRVSGGSGVAGVVEGTAGLSLASMLDFEWEAAIGDEKLTARELAALAEHKAPLVRYRGQWVAVDPRELADIQKRMKADRGRITAREAIVGALAGQARVDGVSAAVTTDGAFASLLERLRDAGSRLAEPPPGLQATLRPYQQRGLAWLETMGALGLGACLADDMGLGKTIQLLSYLLHRRARFDDPRPALLVAPTSVLGNWEREAARFAPDLSVVRHYGGTRTEDASDIPQGRGTLVVTSYGLLRRDVELFRAIEWSTVVLDEAQNIKNAASATAKAAYALPAAQRFALTGTPVENRLAELWSIFEFASPGLLGPLETFRRELAVPIERYGNDQAAQRLRSITSPFLLRRLKSDSSIIQDLPAKNEMKVVCTLSREQASLYQAVVDEELRRIQSSEGIERRGRVLALLSYLKQICNHPAQYLGDAGPLAKRSGKLDRATEMLEEALAGGDKALVFTQFREMGDRLVEHLGARLGTEVLFLHGGTPKKARDEMVRRFQEEPHGPRIFVLSVKAGGTGLNLTAASHVFHFDRWWNPAVEDQATDRAYRIGQKRAVQVHKLLCAGTVEEKVARMLDQKRALASKVVGTGETWITELDDGALRELVTLSKDAVVGGDEDDEVAMVARPKRATRTKAEARA